MNSLQVGGNLTVVSILQLIFIYQNYRTVNVYSDCSKNEVFNEIIKIASGSLKAIQHMNIDAISMTESSYDEPVLNILLVNDLKYLVENSLFGTTVILSLYQNDVLSDTLTSKLKVSSRVILLTNFHLYTLNNFVETKLNKLSLENVNVTIINRFLGTFFSIEGVRGSALTIFTQFSPPKSELTQIDNNYCMIGPDGVVVELLVKWLNITPKFSSSVGIKHPNYRDWLNSSKLSLRLHYQQYHSAVLTKNVVTIFNHNLNSAFDLQMTAFPDQGKQFSKRINVSTEALFHHSIDCLTAIVPHQHVTNDFLRKVVLNPNTFGVGFTLLLFIMWRLFLNAKMVFTVRKNGLKYMGHYFVVIFFQTLGVFFNQNRVVNNNRMKVAWDINLRTFSVFATTVLSAIVFRNLIALDSNDINSIDDLIKSKLTIYAPDYLKKQDIWQHISPALRSKVNFRTANDIESRLVNEQKFDFAYIYFDVQANYIAMVANSKVPRDSRQRVRLMKEKIHCTLAAYRVPKHSPLAKYVNYFILQMLDNGIYHKQLEWMHDLNEAVFATKRNLPPKRDSVVLTMEMTVDVFVAYLAGMGLAVTSFTMEILIFRIHK